jgi:molybdate-binding protein
LSGSSERTETDLALAIAAGRADVGLGIEASARQFQLEFTPMIVERFDLLVWRKAYFDPPFQKLIGFCASKPFERRAKELGGLTSACSARCISTGHKSTGHEMASAGDKAAGLTPTALASTPTRRR